MEKNKMIKQFAYEMIKAKSLEDEKNKKRLIKLPINSIVQSNKKEGGTQHGKR